MKIYFKRLKKSGRSGSIPQYMTERFLWDGPFCLFGKGSDPETRREGLIPTGISLSIPEGFEGQVRPRSGLAIHQGIGIVNGPGTIDSDYRGEIGVLLINFGQEPFTIRDGDRIAQLVILQVFRAFLEEVEALPPHGGKKEDSVIQASKKKISSHIRLRELCEAF